MGNKTVYPYGTGGQLPSGIAIADDLQTDRADVALSARQGKRLGELVKEFPLDFGEVAEDGIFFVDEALNIGARLNSDGFTAINSIEVELL